MDVGEQPVESGHCCVQIDLEAALKLLLAVKFVVICYITIEG